MIISSERSCFKETREAGNRAKRDMVQHLDIHFWTQNVLRKFPTFAEFVSWLDCMKQGPVVKSPWRMYGEQETSGLEL